MDISAFDPNMQEELRRLFPQEINEENNAYLMIYQNQILMNLVLKMF